MSEAHCVIRTAHGRVAILTFDRPEKRNAFDTIMRRAFVQAMREAGSDPDVRAIVLTGSSPQAFISGADISELAGRTPVEQGRVMQRPTPFDLVERCPKPVIAAIGGYCLGAGLELAMACDLRIAGENARFGQPEVNLGIIPGGGGTQRLPRLIGLGPALRLILTGEMIAADEALRLRLVDELVPSEVLLDHAVSVAERIATRSPVALAAAKEATRASMSLPLDQGMRLETALFQLCFASEDRREGMRAFLEKRAPSFSSR